MSLFFDLLCAVNSPNQRASVSELKTFSEVLDQMSQQYGAARSELETALSIIGPQLRAVLQQQMGVLQQPADVIVRQMAETETVDALHTVIPPSVYSQMSEAIAERTSLSEERAESILSMLIPAAMHLLDLGAQSNVNNSNLLVSRFLNSDRDRDLGEVARFIHRMVDVPAA